MGVLFPYHQAVPSLPPRARLAKRKASAPHSVPHSPQPPRCAKGASLFVPDSSRAFLSRPRTMHDEVRTGPPDGHALSIPQCRAAPIKITLSFQNLEAALPPGIPAGRRSNSRSSARSFPYLPFHEGEAPQAYACGGGDASPINCMPELATIGSIPAACGRSAWRDQGSFFPPWKKRSREVWMPSEPRRPDGVLNVRRRARGEECAADRDRFRRTGRTCI